MAENRLKYLNRAELIDIIYQYQCKYQEQAETIERLTVQLDDKKSRIQNAGSIAEAALALNHVFDAAQQAADQYLQEVKDAYAGQEEARRQIIAKAEQEADEIRRQAHIEAEVILEEARRKYLAIHNRIRELQKKSEKHISDQEQINEKKASSSPNH